MATIDNRQPPDCQAAWEIWYQDSFDRESPRRIEIAGRGLLEGLVELWARHLFETVQADGRRGFSRFNLWWKQERKSIEIVGHWEGLVRLRQWMYGDLQQTDKGYLREEDKAFLNKIAARHKKHILEGKTSEAILTAAKAARNREDFEHAI